MKKLQSRNPAVIHLAFLVLFPGFFFYNSALATGAINAVMAGYFSPVALLFMPALLFFYLREIKQNKRSFTRADFAFLLFLLYFFLIVALNFAIRVNQDLARDHLLSILQFAALFVIFKMADFNSSRFRLAAFICLLIMGAIVFFLSIDGFFNLKEQGEFGNSEYVSTYQGFALSYLVTFIAVVPFLKSLSPRLCMYLIGVATLFLNGSRSELVALISLIAVTEILHARRRLAILLFTLALLSLLNIYSDDIVRLLPDNRELELLDLSQSTSWQIRRLLTLHAIKIISAHPILGDYGNYYYGNCCMGTYAHNILSAWVDLGLFGFIYLLCLLIIPAFFLLVDIIYRKTDRHSQELIFAFSLFFITLLLLFTSKNFTFMLSASAVGRYARYRVMQATGTARAPIFNASGSPLHHAGTIRA